IGDLRCRWGRRVVEGRPEDGVPGSQRNVVGRRATHNRLVEIVAGSILVGQALQYWRIAIQHVEEPERVTAGVIARKRYERIQIVEASGWVGGSRVGDVAIRLLPHVEEAMDRVTGIRIIWQGPTCNLERGVGQV